MKHTLDRSAVQLVLCQHIKDLDVEELIDAFERATGERLKVELEDTEEEAFHAELPLPDLIEDHHGLTLWLAHMWDVCRRRLKSNE